jgi:hypothetical protein
VELCDDLGSACCGGIGAELETEETRWLRYHNTTTTIKNIGVPYTLADISKAPNVSMLGAFVLGVASHHRKN